MYGFGEVREWSDWKKRETWVAVRAKRADDARQQAKSEAKGHGSKMKADPDSLSSNQ
ncbi:hypothetical protein [Halomarina oriensis]|uniref:Uncharacterized protein n=1 Tax=Halomarina oriensis TaxID=671145 RepID=A0A6B0GSX6_9EURY|nr:hypothetical protein [Halomarina oriensis]MWG36457.1 hypothetical protein [Halomarina oriensis]